MHVKQCSDIIMTLPVHAIRNELALQKGQTKTVVGQTSDSIVRTQEI